MKNPSLFILHPSSFILRTTYAMVDELPTPDAVAGNTSGSIDQPPLPTPDLTPFAEEAPPATPPSAEAPPETPATPEPSPPAPSPSKKRWYVVKIQSGREESIKEAIERRVKIEGLEEYFGQIVIPVERVTEMSKGKRVVKERKLYPGYLMVEVEYNDRILYLFRETSGVGDFVGGGPNHLPPPMSDREVERIITRGPEAGPVDRPTKPKYDRGDRVKVKDGTFAGMEGEVKELIEAKGCVRVELTIFGRGVPVELEYWQVDHV
jgi:transcriptional antiterminator NusG